MMIKKICFILLSLSLSYVAHADNPAPLEKNYCADGVSGLTNTGNLQKQVTGLCNAGKAMKDNINEYQKNNSSSVDSTNPTTNSNNAANLAVGLGATTPPGGSAATQNNTPSPGASAGNSTGSNATSPSTTNIYGHS